MPSKESSHIEKRKVASQQQLEEEGSSLAKKEAEHRNPKEMAPTIDNPRGSLAKQPRPTGLEGKIGRQPEKLYQDLAQIRQSNPQSKAKERRQ